jgi:dienelactone hydrolase
MRLSAYLDAAGKMQPITDAVDWQQRRAHILANMQLVTGPLPDRSDLIPLDMEVLETVSLSWGTRKKVTFAAEPGDRVPVYLLIPGKLTRKAPAMLCLHQTTQIGKGEPAGLGGKPNLHYALELAERGYITLAPDYPNFGDYTFDPYDHGYVSATMKGIWNHMRAVDLLQSLPEVDAEHIGCIGHSLGGHNTVFVAVFDTRLKVMVSSCGFNSFFKYYGGDLKGWSHKGYMPRIADMYGKDPNQMPFDFAELVAALAPRAFFVNAPINDSNFELSGVKDCIDAAAPVYALLRAKHRLVAVYPDAEHDFPLDAREAAYAFVDEVLKK